MDQLQQKRLNVSRGLTYTYYTRQARPSHQTLLLVHGFPDSPDEFSDVVRDYLLPNGYGVIAIDCLGYGGTSKPLDHEAYSFQLMAQDIKEILDEEGVDQVVSTGHDWGSPVAQRFYNFHPDRVCGLVLLSVAYTAPSPRPFDLDTVLKYSIKRFGYGMLWYWKLFIAPDAVEITDSHLESMWTSVHGEPETWLDTLAAEDGIRRYLVADKRQPVMSYATEERRQRWLRHMSSGGFAGPLNYYRAAAFGTQDKAHAMVPRENHVVKVPHLFFGGSRDVVCRPELCDDSIKAGLLPDCTKVAVDSGHWAHLDKSKEFGETLLGWLRGNFPRSRL
ncbi:hypothetical protein LTR10_024050 [Elasticomyces elasticus]|nr:hypothetical protein LTR10_024050 [Elasticomyces elasticus]KAK5028945.1 hypothetical protein LTS07_006327 [Exophiala sideris]KAK5181576.1 hypothetical protein LTR44_005774 [Eurotiomycetes sp. CCFEE 6388]